MIEPFPHQLEVVKKLAKLTIPSRLIADDMGLGKTLEGILIDAELRSERQWKLNPEKRPWPPYKRPTLIVAPKATHYDAWYRDLYEVLSGIDGWTDDAISRNVEIIDPKNRVRLSQRLAAGREHWPMYVVVHYEALRLMPELADVKWFHIIADEIHRAKNRKAQQTHYLKMLPTFFKTGLSGTPADDKPQDIWSILNWLYPEKYKSYWRFISTYCTQESTEVRGQGRSFRKITGVNRDRIPELHREWAPWYIRRTKDEVGIDLPPKYYTELHVDLLPNQRRAYDQMKRDMIAWIGQNEDVPLTAPVVVAQLVRLQQMALASVEWHEEYTQIMPPAGGGEAYRGLKPKLTLVDPSAKLDRLVEIVEGNPNEPLVIFSQSKSMVSLTVSRLRGLGIDTVPYHGGISDSNRELAVRQFQDGRAQMFVATIAAGGEGITLHRASTVVFFDRMWNPTKNRQAEDRLHRIGQHNPVQVIDIMARDTVDQGRHQRIANKMSELKALLGDTT
jgi:SNF2 family DNA or RNA helicase